MSLEPGPIAQPDSPTTPSRRRFGIGDLIILSALPLFLLAANRHSTMGHSRGWVSMSRVARVPHQAAPYLLAGSIALVAMRLLPPRPGFGELVLQPGFAGNWAVVVFSTFHLAHMFLDIWRENLELGLVVGFPFYSATSWAGGCLVLGAWGTLRLASAWSPRKEWLDRAGRAWCGLWVLSLAIDVSLSWLKF